jgi:ABC-type multidrug transport system permease subunit
MRLAWVCAVKDLRRLRRDPASLAVWIGIPAFVAVLMVLLFGRAEVMPRGTLLVTDEDASFVSSLFTGSFTQGPLGDMLTVEKVSLADGQKRINRGRGSALLHIPKGFGEAVLAGTPTRLKLVTNPSQAILPDIVKETVSMLAEGAFYLQTLAGDRLRELTRGQAPSELQVVQAAVAFNRLGTTVSGYFNPLRIELVTQVVETRAANTSRLPAALLRSMMFMAVLFLAMGFSTEIWKERRQGVLRRLLAAPAPVGSFVLGRVLAVAVTLAAVASCGLVAGSTVLQASPARLVLGILFLTISGLGIYLLFQVAVMYAPSEKAASMLASLVMFPLAMLGGSFFPFELMPDWMASIGRLTPNGWSVTQLGVLLEGRPGVLDVALMFGGAILLAAAMFWLVARRLRRGFAL